MSMHLAKLPVFITARLTGEKVRKLKNFKFSKKNFTMKIFVYLDKLVIIV